MDTFEHDVYCAYEKPIHLPPIWSPDVDGVDDDVRPEPSEKTLKKGPPDPSVLDPKMGPKMGPRAAQNWIHFLSYFLSNFGVVFGGFWVPSGPKTGPGEIWRSLREQSGAPRGQKDNFQKSGFRMGLSAFFRF